MVCSGQSSIKAFELTIVYSTLAMTDVKIIKAKSKKSIDYICVDKRKFIYCFLNSYADLECSEKKFKCVFAISLCDKIQCIADYVTPQIFRICEQLPRVP